MKAKRALIIAQITLSLGAHSLAPSVALAQQQDQGAESLQGINLEHQESIISAAERIKQMSQDERDQAYQTLRNTLQQDLARIDELLLEINENEDHFEYSKAGLVVGSTLALTGAGAATEFLTDISRNAKGWEFKITKGRPFNQRMAALLGHHNNHFSKQQMLAYTLTLAAGGAIVASLYGDAVVHVRNKQEVETLRGKIDKLSRLLDAVDNNQRLLNNE